MRVANEYYSNTRDAREEMGTMPKKKLLLRMSLIIFAVTLSSAYAGLENRERSQRPSRQQPRADIPKDVEDQYERALNAAEVLRDLTQTPDEGIPSHLLDRAFGIAVFPHVVKAAFGIGGRWGKGLLSVRQGRQWGTPVFVDITGGSFGFQIGGEATDLVLVFMNRRGVDSLLKSKLKLGADATAAAGPVGRSAEAGIDVALNAEIYSYSRSKGLFAGVALDGAVVDFDNSANRDVYGYEGKELLSARRQASPVTAPFHSALVRHTPRSPK